MIDREVIKACKQQIENEKLVEKNPAAKLVLERASKQPPKQDLSPWISQHKTAQQIYDGIIAERLRKRQERIDADPILKNYV